MAYVCLVAKGCVICLDLNKLQAFYTFFCTRIEWAINFEKLTTWSYQDLVEQILSILLKAL